MSIYRQYENPYMLEGELAEAKWELAQNPDNEDLALKVHELEERVNFAWQDDEYDSLHADYEDELWMYENVR